MARSGVSHRTCRDRGWQVCGRSVRAARRRIRQGLPGGEGRAGSGEARGAIRPDERSGDRESRGDSAGEHAGIGRGVEQIEDDAERVGEPPFAVEGLVSRGVRLRARFAARDSLWT